MTVWTRARWGALGFVLVLLFGTVGYVAFGFSVLDALYQTVTTVTTVGFREVKQLSPGGKVFTIVLILVGVGTALYTLGALLEALVEGHLAEHLERRRMQRQIAAMNGHVVICGWGRVGRAIAGYLAAAGRDVVVIDRDPNRLPGSEIPCVLGDVADDDVLRSAGIDRASALVAALDTDADNVFVTLSSRSMRPDLVIIARARNEDSEPKLRRAGADRVVNPQRIGGQRMAAFAIQPYVAEFLDVVMHEGTLEIRIEEFGIDDGSPLAQQHLRDVDLRGESGAVLLAVRSPGGQYVPNPPPSTQLVPGSVLIAMGTDEQLGSLRSKVG